MAPERLAAALADRDAIESAQRDPNATNRTGAGTTRMRTSSACFLLIGLMAACDTAPLAAQELDAHTRARVDSVFIRYDHTDTPGCAVLVRRDGRTAYARGFGMASLELGVAITPQAVMDIGSTSNQFTAAAIWLLAQDGRVSIDDEVQRYLPELPRLAAPVTLRHLLQHTSGWRDYVDLLALGGAQDEEVTTTSDAMAALQRQHAGNFAPGSWWTYSNTGFFLLSQVVERVSGTTMRAFLRERIFAPLGMTHTDLFDDHARVLRGKASSYGPGDDGWRVVTANWEQTGDGAVQTSVEDLAKWDANFDTPVVGGRTLIDSLQQPGQLVDGTPLNYASGLFIDRYRSVRRVSHSGVWAGYRAMSMRFPDQRMAVYLTCNAGDANTETLAESVADAVVGSTLGPSDAELLRDSLRTPARQVVAPLEGLWWDATVGRLLRVTLSDSVATLGSALGGRQRRLRQLPDGWFIQVPVTPLAPRYRLDGATGQLLMESPSGPGVRLTRVPEAGTLTVARLAEYAGHYTTAAIPGVWTVEARGDTLWLSQPRRAAVKLEPLFADGFEADGQPVLFVRDSRGRVNALSVTTRGLRDLRWTRSP